MKRLILTLALMPLLLVAGCTPERDLALDLLDTKLATTQIDDLSNTMDFVFSQRRFEMDEFQDKIESGLNRWASESEIKTEGFNPTPGVEELAKDYDSLRLVQRMNEVMFWKTDSYFLQQASWLKSVVDRVSNSHVMNGFELYRLAADDFQVDTSSETDPLIDVVSKLNGVEGDDAKKLTKVLRMNDWVIRNIQLLDDAPLTEEQREEFRLNDQQADWSAGIPGLGYQRHPWQTLVYSRGDYVDRAKLFILMVQELGLDAVMLGVDQEGSEELKPWAVGVLIGDKTYLFDTKLGLPIPKDKPFTIATLADAQNDEKLLSNLDLSVEESLADNTKYWVTQEQAKNVTAMILISPESVSKRMWAVETSLLGDRRLRLVQSADVGSKFEKSELWDTEFKTHHFRKAIRDGKGVASYDDEVRTKLSWHFTEEAYVDDFVAYRTGRNKYFIGYFETARYAVRKNAVEMFYLLMYTDETIDELATNSVLQKRLGIRKEKQQSASEFQDQLASVQAQMRLVRRDAGFFLSLTHFDNGNFSTCANWLERMEKQEEVRRWKEGVIYLRGRAYEARKEFDRALEMYQEEDLLQFHGNLIRARMLKQISGK